MADTIRWLTTQEAADRACCGARTIRRAVRSGQLRAARLRGELRFLERWIDEWLITRHDRPDGGPQSSERRPHAESGGCATHAAIVCRSRHSRDAAARSPDRGGRAAVLQLPRSGCDRCGFSAEQVTNFADAPCWRRPGTDSTKRTG